MISFCIRPNFVILTIEFIFPEFDSDYTLDAVNTSNGVIANRSKMNQPSKYCLAISFS